MTKKLSDAEAKELPPRVWLEPTWKIVGCISKFIAWTEEELNRTLNVEENRSLMIPYIPETELTTLRQEYAESLGKVREALSFAATLHYDDGASYEAETKRKARSALQLLDALLSATGEGEG